MATAKSEEKKQLTFEEIQEKQREIEQLKKELDEQLDNLKNKKFIDAFKYLEDNKITFAELEKYYYDKNAPVVFSYKLPDGTVFSRKKGQRGSIATALKDQLKAQGRDALATGKQKDYEADGAKVIESIFKKRKTRNS